MKPDPPVRKGCAHCGKPRHPERSKKYGQAAAELDPFCSTNCAKAWHGVPERSVPPLPSSRIVDPYVSGHKGLCACGCGQPVKVAEYNNRRRGHIAGQPVRYVTHHNLQPPK
jgi:hypothetical protein